MTEHISSLDSGYQSGDLSIFPEALDDKETLYEAVNNAIVPLKQTLSFNGKIVIVESTEGFPQKGHIRIGSEPGQSGQFEFIYYGKKTSNTFQELERGFAGSRKNKWSAGAWVAHTVFSDTHNAVKDAVINIETNLGLKSSPDSLSLNGILKKQEVRFLMPKPLFRAFPLKGPPALQVRFQNFTTGHVARYLWDFGDGGTSTEESPIHTYVSEGLYTVKLNTVTSTGAQGIVTKVGYIEVNSDETPPFFYVDSISNPYSIKTATEQSLTPKEFRFIDQTDGDIVQRNWIFGDGTRHTEEDPDVHETTHIYQEPGEYLVTELIQFSNGRLKRVQLPELLVIL